MTHTTYLVDVYAINQDGFDHHLGGGCFVTETSEQAEASAAQEFGAHHWEASGHQIAFMIDTPDKGHYPKPLPEIQAKRLLSHIDTTIPFNE